MEILMQEEFTVVQVGKMFVKTTAATQTMLRSRADECTRYNKSSEETAAKLAEMLGGKTVKVRLTLEAFE